MFNIISHFIIFFFVIFSNGLIYLNLIYRNNLFIFNFFEISIIGLIFTGFLSVFLNFFFPLSSSLLVLNVFVGIITTYLLRKKLIFNYNKICKLFFVLFFILTIANIYGSGFSDDLNHYHGSTIINSDNHKYIVGSNFLNHLFGTSSIWLSLHSFLNFENTFLQDIHVLNGIIFYLLISYLFSEIIYDRKSIAYKNLLSISSILIFFFLIKYSRLKEFGIDRPGVLIYSFIIYFFIKYFYFFKNNKKNDNTFTYILIKLCIFLTSIKITFISCFILPLILLIKSNLNKLIFTKNAIFLYFLLIIIFFKNTLISGCLIYPIDFTCITYLDWNSKDIALKLYDDTNIMYKSFNFYGGELDLQNYLKNFNWIYTWLNKNIEELNNFLFTILVSFILFLISNKSYKKKFKLNKIDFALILIFFVNIIIFIYSPVIRFHHMLVILSSFIYFIFSNKNFYYRKNFFVSIIFILLVFNFSKNIIRINKSDFKNNPYIHIKEVGWYTPPVKMNLNNFEYYKGWIDNSPIGNKELIKNKHKKFMTYDIIYR